MFQNFKYLGEFQWWLNQKATMSRIVSTKKYVFFSINHRFQPRWKNSQPTSASKTSPTTLKIWPTFPRPEDVNPTPSGRIGSIWRHPYTGVKGGTTAPKDVYFRFGGVSLDGGSKVWDPSLSIYRCLSIYDYTSNFNCDATVNFCDKCLILCHWNLNVPWAHQFEGPCRPPMPSYQPWRMCRRCRETLPGETKCGRFCSSNRLWCVFEWWL